MFFSKAYVAVSIIPSEPRVPNPPGTNTPSKLSRCFRFPLSVSESIQSMFTDFPIDAEACLSASLTLT